jgi:hypothetical protein
MGVSWIRSQAQDGADKEEKEDEFVRNMNILKAKMAGNQFSFSSFFRTAAGPSSGMEPYPCGYKEDSSRPGASA